ncbi:hypothetical protein L596_017952 [Steinernema carpocapsae]|uniref:PH-like domain-containing protein n=1 Tax=Steinernema carpocapsae TaxID=34508 RepID=A0A4U5N3K9_STECR|nr:hypothetical protein L596_017952 [Steinernema carpocapsae]
MTAPGVEGQVKILAESFKPGNEMVFETEVDCKGYIATVINALSKNSQAATLHAGKNVAKRFVTRDFDPPCLEFSVDVAADDWSRAFFILVDNFFQGCRMFGHHYGRPEIASLMQMSSFNVLKQEFWPDDALIPLEFFSLGNLMTPYQFLNHIKLSERTVEVDVLNECERMPGNEEGILADFEHDRNLLKVKFGYVHRGGFRGRQGPPANDIACIYVNVPYKSVRRIIVDWEHITNSEVHGAKLYLHLNCPVEIKKAKKRHDGYGKTDRFLTWDQNKAPRG